MASKAVTKDFSEQDREHALGAIAYFSGNARKAQRFLKQQGLTISKSTLYRWRERYAEDYERIRTELIPQIRAEAAEKHSELADLELEVSRALVERLSREAAAIPVRDLPGAVRNLDVAAGVNRDKTAILAGEPTQIHASQDLAGVLRELKALGWDVQLPGASMDEVIEGEAIEIPAGSEQDSGPEQG